ncbi:MAG: DUF2061 domain-containing protein [Haloferacaceae archaeon]
MFAYVCREHPVVAKTVAYRVISVVTTALVAYALVGDLSTAVDVGVLANAVKMGLYYVHERTWETYLPAVVE